MTCEIRTFNKAQNLFAFLNQKVLEHADYVFRGHPDDYPLVSTWRRSYGNRFEEWKKDIEEVIEEFQVNLAKIGKTPFITNDKLDWLEFARHHGVPTRVLDFSYSPFVALFFAVNGLEKDRIYKKRGSRFIIVYMVETTRMAHAYVKDIYRKHKDSQYMEFMDKCRFGDETAFEDGYPANLLQVIPFPGSKNIRMQRQLGLFIYDTINYEHTSYDGFQDLLEKTVEPDLHLPDKTIAKGKPTLTKIRINVDCTQEIFELLEVMNIAGRNLFDNPEGAAMDTRNSYFYNAKTKSLRDISKYY